MSENPKNRNGWTILTLTILFVLSVWILNWIFVWNYFGKSDERGDFGDMFGAINALFSGLAFAFLIYTIWLQREELKLQREELRLQRIALELQVDELKRQADELEKTSVLQKESLDLQKINREELRKERERTNKANFIQSGDFEIILSNRCRLHLILKNRGASASNVRVECNPHLDDLKLSISQGGFVKKTIPNVEQNHIIHLWWAFENIEDIPITLEINII